MTSTTTTTNDEERAINGIQALMHGSLSTALHHAMKNFPDCRVELIVPIALSRLVYREIVILSAASDVIQEFPDMQIEQWRDLFVALLNDLIDNKIELRKLRMISQKENSNGTQ